MPARPRYLMPDFIREALDGHGVMGTYRARPSYQQNDYLGSLCVIRGQLQTTRQKRFNQRLDELKGGKLYMNMKWNSKTGGI